jgi:FMN phosphatase YigB (HAD superfamily)
MVKRVSFDIGNVLCHVDTEALQAFILNKEIVGANARSAEQLFSEVNEFISKIHKQQDVGECNLKQGLALINPQLDERTIQQLYDVWIDIARPSTIMLNLVEELIEKHGYEVSLLSNIGFDHAELIRQKCSIFKKCNQHFSCDIGIAKPSVQFYETFISKYKWDRDVLFFDDRICNIEAAGGFLTGVLFDIEKFESDDSAAQVMRNHLGL